MYDNLEIARHVVDDLVRAEFGRENISLVAADQQKVYTPYVDRAAAPSDGLTREVVVGDVDQDGFVEREAIVRGRIERAHAVGSEVAEGAGIGALIGGLGGLLVGLGALAIPGVGPIIAAGPILAAITGAGLGAVTGGMVGVLVDLGIPDAEAHVYAEGVRRGYNMVAVQAPESRVDQAKLIMDRAGLVDLQQHVGEWRETGWNQFDPNAEPYMRPV
jgi:hypothetical protein